MRTGHSNIRSLPFGWIAFLTLLIASTSLTGQEMGRAALQNMDEYQVKAGFVSSFANFVEWPPETFHDAREPLTICVLGDNPFGAALTVLSAGKSVEGHALRIREIPDPQHAPGCQILFISASEHLRLRAIIHDLGSQSIFSVGDTSDFISEGGIANLQIESGRVRFEINDVAARERRLRVSSRLLQLAKNVKR